MRIVEWAPAATVAVMLNTGPLFADAPAPDETPGSFSPAPYVVLCGTAAGVSELLRRNGEAIVAKGITAKAEGPGLVAQFWVNPKTHDWTVVYLDPVSGTACMIAAGTAFGIDRSSPGGTRSGAT